MLCLNKIALSQYFLHVSLSRGLPSCCLAATYIMVLPWYSTKSAKHAETFSAVLNPWESILTPDCISCQNTLVIDTPRVRSRLGTTVLWRRMNWWSTQSLRVTLRTSPFRNRGGPRTEPRGTPAVSASEWRRTCWCMGECSLEMVILKCCWF